MGGVAVGREVGGREQPAGVLAHQQRPVGPVADEVAIVPALREHHRGQPEGERAVGAGAHAQPLVGAGGRARAPRIDHDQRGAARDRLRDRGGLGEVGGRRVVAPQEQAGGPLEVRGADVGAEGERGRVVAMPRAELLAPHHVGAPERADEPVDPREAVGDRGARGRGDRERHRLGALALGQRAHALRGPVERLVPGDAHPARVGIAPGPRAAHRVEQPIGRVHQLRRGLPLHAQVPAGRMRRVGLDRDQPAVLHHRHAPAARAAQRAEAGHPLGGHGAG